MKRRNYLAFVFLTLAFSLACQFITGNNATNVIETPTRLAQEPSPEATIPASPLAGLTYRVYRIINSNFGTSRQEVWQFGSDGLAHKIFEGDHIVSGAIFSSDGKQLAYTDFGPAQDRENCLWRVDYESKTASPLTCGGDHGLLGWIPTQADKLLSTSIWDTQTGDGGLEAISLSDGSVQPLESSSVGAVDISLDGSVAYDNASSYGEGALGRLFRWESGVEDFKPQDYGVNYPTIDRPAWSPDGKKIAWGLKDGFNHAFGVFDLANRTALALHPYESAPSMRNSSPYVSWSPDGNWLAASICAYNGQSHSSNDLCDPEKSGSWIMGADGQTEFKLETGDFFDWSPDSQWVFYTVEPESAGDKTLWVSRLDGSQSAQLGVIHFAYQETIWGPDGKFIAFMDNQNSVWLAEIGVWQPMQVASIEAPPNPNGDRQWIFLDGWFEAILPTYDTLTIVPVAP